MLTRIYRFLHRLASRTGEKGEYSGGYLQDRIRREALSLCRHAEGRLLEIGCGEGLFLTQVTGQNRRLEVWGIDNDDARLKAAALRLRNVNLSRQDAAKLSFEDGYFDMVICINVLFNMRSIDEVKRTLEEMKRVCRDDGRIIFDFRNSANPILPLKYKLAKYYDDTLKGLPLNTYSIGAVTDILKETGLAVSNKRFIGLPRGALAPVIMIGAVKRC